MITDLKSVKKVIGVKQSLKVVSGGKSSIVYIARDAEGHVIRELKELCHKNSVEIQYMDTMKQLGESCGIEVGAAAAAIIK